ncbi:unnamed protein product [Prunus armeniaca]
MVTGGAAATIFYNLRQRHPSIELPLIDYDLALLFQPMLVNLLDASKRLQPNGSDGNEDVEDRNIPGGPSNGTTETKEAKKARQFQHMKKCWAHNLQARILPEKRFNLTWVISMCGLGDHIQDIRFGWKIAVGTMIAFVGAAFGNVGGVGGGGFFIPMLTLIIGFDQKSSIVVSKCMIADTATARSCIT